MQLDLPPDVLSLVERRIRSGEYRHAGEVVTAALRLLEARDSNAEYRQQRLSRLLKEGSDDLALGRHTSGEVVMAGLRQRGRAMRDEA